MNFESPNNNENIISKEKNLEEKVPKANMWRTRAIALLSALSIGQGGLRATPIDPKLVKEKTSKITPEKVKEGTGEESTYTLSSKDFEKTMPSFSFYNLFELNKAEISEENKQKIVNQVHEFLKNISSENVKQILYAKKVIESSCSPELVGDEWNHKNELLAIARGEEAENIIKEAIKIYNFSGNNLTKNEIDGLENMEFEVKIPNKTNIELGVTPDPEGFNNLSKEEQEQIRQKARYVKFYIELDESEVPIKDLFSNLSEKINESTGKTIIGIDNSGSMVNSKNLLIKEIERQSNLSSFSNAYLTVFSHDVDESRISLSSFGDIENYLKNSNNINKNNDERVISSASILSREINSQEGGQVILVTDEKIQDLSYNSLQSLLDITKKNNVSVEFWLLPTNIQSGDNNINNDFVKVVSLEEINTVFINFFSEKYGKLLDTLKEKLNENELSGDKRKIKSFKEQISDIENTIISIGRDIHEKPKINLSQTNL